MEAETRQVPWSVVSEWINDISTLADTVHDQFIDSDAAIDGLPVVVNIELSNAEWLVFDQITAVVTRHPGLVCREFVLDGKYGPNDWCSLDIGFDVAIHNYEMDNEGLALDDPSRSRNLSMIRNLKRIYWAFENAAFQQEAFQTEKFTVALMPEQWKLFDHELMGQS